MSEETEVRLSDYVWKGGLRHEVVDLPGEGGFALLTDDEWVATLRLRHLGGRTWRYVEDDELGDQGRELAELREAHAVCGRGHCDAAYAQNEEGGHARQVVAATAKALGFDLWDDKPTRDVWHPANMQRVVYRARGAAMAIEAQKQYIAHLSAVLVEVRPPAFSSLAFLQASLSTRGL